MRKHIRTRTKDPPAFDLPDTGRVWIIEKTMLPGETMLYIGKTSCKLEYFLILPFATQFFHESWLLAKISKTWLDRLIDRRMTLYTAFRCPEYGEIVLARKNRLSKAFQFEHLPQDGLPDDFLAAIDCFLSIQ